MGLCMMCCSQLAAALLACLKSSADAATSAALELQAALPSQVNQDLQYGGMASSFTGLLNEAICEAEALAEGKASPGVSQRVTEQLEKLAEERQVIDHHKREGECGCLCECFQTVDCRTFRHVH